MRKDERHQGQTLPLRIAVNPMIMDRLRREDEQVLIDLERRCGTQLTFVSDSNLHIEEFRIGNGATGELLYDGHDHE